MIVGGGFTSAIGSWAIEGLPPLVTTSNIFITRTTARVRVSVMMTPPTAGFTIATV